MSADRVAHRAVGASWSILRGFVAGWRLVLLLLLQEIVLPVEPSGISKANLCWAAGRGAEA